MSNRRTRVTVSLPTELVVRVDRHARARNAARSTIVEEWLRAGARRQAQQSLDDEITAYYTSLTPEEVAENAAIAAASAAAARRLDIDDAGATRTPRPRKRRRSA